jgi:predicted RNA binding protein YcfA (HicA-like mRNA interferase family)
MIMQKTTEGGSTTTVPVPDHRELRLGTLTSIIKRSGLPRSLFEQR